MRKSLAALAIAITVAAVMSPFDAEAKRLGGAKSAGMQRQNVTAPANTPGAAPGTPGTPAQAAPAAGMAAAAAPAAAAAATKRSWMGPLAGLAAGLGIAALASHFGFGEALANMMTIALVVMAVLLLVGFILRKRAQQRGGMQPAFGGAAPGGAFGSNGGPGFDQQQPMQRNAGLDQQPVQRSPLGAGGSLIGSGLAGGAGAAAAGAATQPSFPPGFDAAGFERNAKDQFMALQSANDAGDLQRLRDYLTPEMFELARDEVQQRGAEQQVTQVFGLQAQVLDVTTEADRYVVSVRFTGSIRQQHGAVPDALDEIWHLVKPLQGMGGWLVAGIQQVEGGEGPR